MQYTCIKDKILCVQFESLTLTLVMLKFGSGRCAAPKPRTTFNICQDLVFLYLRNDNNTESTDSICK